MIAPALPPSDPLPPTDPISRRVLQIAFVCHPDRSMETRNGWKRAVHAARRHKVTLLYGEATDEAELQERARLEGVGDNLQCVRVEAGPLGRRMLRSATTYYAGLRLWHIEAFRVAREQHAASPFDLVHQTTYCGYREPGYGWKLGVPFIWGPVGGTHGFPLRFLSQLTSARSIWIELCRNTINAFQLRLGRRVRKAAKRSTCFLAATRASQEDFQNALGVKACVQLETAIDPLPESLPRKRDPEKPLNILWAGRLRPWKTLPILLRALSQTPANFDYRLRVMGVGPCEARWRQLADRLGIADRVEWIGWPEYTETWPQYQWADAFAFTSMRDTSGTGLLEALACGTPIVSVNHQGAADIVNEGCGLLAPVQSPKETIAAFAEHLQRLADDPQLWGRLSKGAQAEALKHTWDHQAEALLGWYDDALAIAPQASQTASRRAESSYARLTGFETSAPST